MTNVQKLNEALKPGSSASFRVDEHGGLHIGEVSRPVDAEARLKLQEAERLLEARSREEMSTVFGQLCGVEKVNFDGYSRGPR